MMGVIEDYLDSQNVMIDADALLDPDIGRFEGPLYSASLVYKYYPPMLRGFFVRPQVRFSQRAALNDPFEMSRRWREASADGLRQCLTDSLREVLPKMLSNADLMIARVKEEFTSAGITLMPWQENVFQQFLKSEAGQIAVANQAASIMATMPSFVEGMFAVLDAQFESFVDKWMSNAGVFSLSEDHLNQPMWAHYALQGRGFVVGFDARHPFFLSTDGKAKNLLRKVLYTDDWTENFWRNPYYLFLVKSASWAYEREWRMLKDLDKCDERKEVNGMAVCLWNLPPEVIKVVYFGYTYSEEDRTSDVQSLVQCGASPEFYSVRVNRVAGTIEAIRLPD